jgi:hypothetical protein
MFIKHSLKMIMFSKDSFKVSLCSDSLCCMCLFVSLEEAYRSRNNVGIKCYPKTQGMLNSLSGRTISRPNIQLVSRALIFKFHTCTL